MKTSVLLFVGWVCCCWSLTAFENSIKAKKVNGMGAIFVVVVGFTNGFKIHNNSLPSQQMGLDILYYSDRVSVQGTSINDVQFQGRQEGPKLAQTIARYRVHGRQGGRKSSKIIGRHLQKSFSLFFSCMLSSNSIAGNKYQFQLGYGISCTEYEN